VQPFLDGDDDTAFEHDDLLGDFDWSRPL